MRSCLRSRAMRFVTARMLRGFAVRRATTESEREAVYRVRFEGYGRYYRFRSVSDAIDHRDDAPNCVLLFVETERGGAIGTMRILDRRSGSIELDAFVDVDALLRRRSIQTCAEATRLTVVSSSRVERSHALVLLFRSFYDYCRINGIGAMILSTTSRLATVYEKLHFEDVGEGGAYHHPQLGEKPHRTYLAPVKGLHDRFCARCSLTATLICQPLPAHIPYHALIPPSARGDEHDVDSLSGRSLHAESA